MAKGQTRESVKMALDTLRANKLRSGLTILGIVIGVTTVITISSIINGINNRVADWVSSLGSNVLWVSRMPFINVNPTTEMLTRKYLTLDDVVALRQLPHVVATDGELDYFKAFEVGQVSAKYNGKKVSGAIVEGNTSEWQDVVDLTMIEGRLFNDDEDMRGAHVCVLGHDTWDTLFDGLPAVGKEINVESGLCTVIGVEDREKSLTSGKNPDDNAIHFPMTTFRHMHPETRDMQISIKYDDPKYRDLVEDEVRELLRIRRRVKVQADDNFELTSPDAISKLWGQLTGGLAAFMIAVSSVGLMVGGIGVMNIMLVSVTERTREIGVRKAIGATQRTILTQFTTEAITLCAIGGVIGVMVGAVITWIVYFLPIGLPATLSTVWVCIGFGVSCAIGLLFGIYPAWKAATLDPIEALRYE
ncbi:MAG: ABC transporter permease [Terracidiphilus sp.]|jgi:putative ABC transport system permease protein